MSESEEDSDDKPFEASQKRLDDARKKGEVPHSKDLTSAGTFGGLLLVALGMGATSLAELGAVLAGFLSRAEELSIAFTGGPFAAASQATLVATARPLSFWFALPFLAALLLVVLQRALVFAPEKLQPKLERISPIKGAKNKFGRNGLFEFAKSTAKLILISLLLALFLIWRLPEMMASMALEESHVTGLLLRLSAEFLAIVFLITLCLGAIDGFWQVAEHQRKHRMSKKELTDESKESDGDPWMKSRRREKGIEISQKQMIADVRTADVVIVNPTHFAVALKWDRARGGAPVCVAKGVDHVAMRMRETAAEAGVPIRSDPPTARALFRIVEIGHEVPPEHYRAVAVAIRFAEAMRKRAGGSRGN